MTDSFITLASLSGMLMLLIRDTVRPDYVFLGGLTVLLVTGVLTPQQAFSGFSNPAVFTVGALFIIAAGVQRTGALYAIERFIFKTNTGYRWVLTKMMTITGVSSAFLNNTPIVAMMIPQVTRWSGSTQQSASRLLIPLSYAAIIGGMITLIGTSTNLVVSGMLDERGYEPLTMFELSWIGIPAIMLVIAYFNIIGYKWLPNRLNNNKLSRNTQSNGYQFDYKIPENSKLDGLTVDRAGLRALEKAFLTHVYRNRQIIGPIGPQFILQSGDVLTLMGDVDFVDQLAIEKGLDRAVPRLKNVADELPLFEAVVAPTSILVGKTLKEIQFRELFHAVVVGIQRRDEAIRGALSNIAVKRRPIKLTARW